MEHFFDIHHHFLGRKNGIYNWDLGEEIPENYFSAGLHPKDISSHWENDWNQIKEKSQNENCIAIGECGLDALVKTDEVLQEKVFLEQILWANEIQKPVIIHCVRRFSSLLKFQKVAKTPLIIHGFNKKKSIAQELLEKGFYLSFGKALLDSFSLQETVKECPLDRIFLETDTAEIEIEKVYQKLSELKKINLEELNFIISQNVKEVFKIN